MQIIDPEKGPRKAHFAFFNSLDYPHFNLTARVDMAPLYHFAKAHDISIFRAILYITSHVANEIPEFRHRIREGKIIEHELVHPSYTSMTDQQVFSFTDTTYDPDPQRFWKNCDQAEAKVKSEANLEDDANRDDYLFVTSIPWVHFTSFQHPIHISGIDSVPRISWGKFLKEGNHIWLPLSMQAHHALLDGWHIGQFFMRVEAMLQKPEASLNQIIK